MFDALIQGVGEKDADVRGRDTHCQRRSAEDSDERDNWGTGNQKRIEHAVIGTDTDDLTRIAQDIAALGIEINDEDLIHREYFRPYAPFGPRDEELVSPVTGVAGLAGDADVVEIIVRDKAPIAGKTLKEANEEGLVTADVLVVRINREEETITPTGETKIEAGDFVTIHSRSGLTDETLEAFTGD